MAQDSADLFLKVILSLNAVGTSIVGILVFAWTRNSKRAVDEALLAQRVELLEDRADGAAKDHRFRGDQIAALSERVGRLEVRVDGRGRSGH